MPRPALGCTVNLKIKQVTCPGTLHLMDRNLVFVTVSIIAQTRRTKSVFASFPFIFNEKMVFERIFTNARTLDHVLEILEDEIVSIELRQYSERYDDGMVLARFEQPTRQFLFPGPTFVPKNDIKREILLTRTSNFSAERGIDPKMEFYTSTKIEEVSIASSSREHRYSTPTYSARKSLSPRKSSSPSPRKTLKTPSSSETEEEIIITTPRDGQRNRRKSANPHHCICECPYRPENNGRVVIRSRSVSLGRDKSRKSWYTKPPFKVGKAPQELISRRDFGEASCGVDGSPSRKETFDACPDCLIPHPQCTICMAYKQTYGSCFLRHRFPDNSSRPRHKQSPVSSERQTPRKTRVKIPKLRARIPISSPDNSSDDDSYRAALTVASERRRNRPNIFEKRDDYWNNGSVTPDSGNTSRRSRTGENVRSTVKGLLRKNDSVLQYELSDSEAEHNLGDIEKSSFRSMESPILTSSLKSVPDRSIVVPLSSEKYWSQKAHKYQGKSHREIFNDSLGEIYKDMYNRTFDSD